MHVRIVDGWRQYPDAHVVGKCEIVLELVRIRHFIREVRSKEFCGVVRLQECCLVCDDGIGDRM